MLSEQCWPFRTPKFDVHWAERAREEQFPSLGGLPVSSPFMNFNPPPGEHSACFFFFFLQRRNLNSREGKEMYAGSCNHQMMSDLTIPALCATPRFKQLLKRTVEEMSQMKISLKEVRSHR